MDTKGFFKSFTEHQLCGSDFICGGPRLNFVYKIRTDRGVIDCTIASLPDYAAQALIVARRDPAQLGS